MICKNCGTQFSDDSQFCPVCGSKADAAPASAAAINGTDSNSTYALIFGVLGLVFSGILGIIFSAIAIAKGNAFKRENGTICGNAQAGKVFGIVGLVKALLVVVLVILYIIIFAAIFATAGSGVLEEIFAEY